MAISEIKKIELIGLKKDEGQILSLLQKLALVELISIQEIDIKFAVSQQTTDIIAENIHLLAEIEEAISYLGSFQEKAGFLKGIVKLKPIIYQDQLSQVIDNFDYTGLLKGLSQRRSHLKGLFHHKEQLAQEANLLYPWRNLNIPLSQIRPTRRCSLLLGVLATRDYAGLMEDFAKEDARLFCEIVSQDRTNAHLLIMYLSEEFERLETLLKGYRFNFVTLPRRDRLVTARLSDINAEIATLEKQIKDAEDKIRGLSGHRLKLMAVYDYLGNLRTLRESDRDLAKQQFTFSLTGWIRAKDIKLLEGALSDKFETIAIFISEAAGEEVPVDLENNRLIQPFEFITRMYGMPRYNEIDPTPFLALFFFLYFGLCVSDAGYGLLLIGLCWFMLKKFPLGPQGLRFFRLFLYCGISTVIIGGLTGSWFGDLVDVISQNRAAFMPVKKFKDSLIFLDPLKEPTKLLGIALGLGIIQVWFGNIVAAIGNIKNRRYFNVLLDQVPTLTLLFGLTGLGLIFLKLLGNAYLNLFKNTALLGAIGLILTQGRAERSLGSKLFFGAYNLYNSLSGYLSDVLSYSRLWALGLVTAVMASTINLVSVQFSQILVSIIPFINNVTPIKTLVSGIILIAIFVAGHCVSFFMNLLGAFVHPVRLQFVEFFSKFFKATGSAFKPFKIETKYVNIK